MSGTDERAIAERLADGALYRADRAAWAAKAGPRWFKRMKAEAEADKRESWRVAGPELRAAIRRYAELQRTSP